MVVVMGVFGGPDGMGNLFHEKEGEVVGQGLTMRTRSLKTLPICSSK